MNNNVTSAGTEAESSTKDEFLPSAPLAANPMLAAMSAIEKQVIWEDACNTILKDIANTFLSKSNQNKAGLQSDKDVFQAIGETIQNFPIPKYYEERLDFRDLLKRVSEYNCPNMKKDEYKTKENCPLKDKCKCLNDVSK